MSAINITNAKSFMMFLISFLFFMIINTNPYIKNRLIVPWYENVAIMANIIAFNWYFSSLLIISLIANMYINILTDITNDSI